MAQVLAERCYEMLGGVCGMAQVRDEMLGGVCGMAQVLAEMLGVSVVWLRC